MSPLRFSLLLAAVGCGPAAPVCFDAGTERCNGVDDDCDGLVDADDPDIEDATSFYPDADGDGAGAPHGAVVACEAPLGLVASADDCDDADPDVQSDDACATPDSDGTDTAAESDPPDTDVPVDTATSYDADPHAADFTFQFGVDHLGELSAFTRRGTTFAPGLRVDMYSSFASCALEIDADLGSLETWLGSLAVAPDPASLNLAGEQLQTLRSELELDVVVPLVDGHRNTTERGACSFDPAGQFGDPAAAFLSPSPWYIGATHFVTDDVLEALDDAGVTLTDLHGALAPFVVGGTVRLPSSYFGPGQDTVLPATCIAFEVDASMDMVLDRSGDPIPLQPETLLDPTSGVIPAAFLCRPMFGITF